MKELSLAELTSHHFQDLLNQKFRLLAGREQWLDIELIEVAGLPACKPWMESQPEGRPFSLVFRGPMERVVPQGIHAIEHERLGRLEIFLVPIGPDAVGMRLQAIFN